MIIALMAGWVLTGLLLALLVGGAVRIAEARGDWSIEVHPLDVRPEVEVVRA